MNRKGIYVLIYLQIAFAGFYVIYYILAFPLYVRRPGLEGITPYKYVRIYDQTWQEQAWAPMAYLERRLRSNEFLFHITYGDMEKTPWTKK